MAIGIPREIGIAGTKGIGPARRLLGRDGWVHDMKMECIIRAFGTEIGAGSITIIVGTVIGIAGIATARNMNAARK